MQIKTLGKHGLELKEYKGEYSLIATYEGKDGKAYQQWGKPKVGKDAYAVDDRPFKVILGDKVTAIKVLRELLAELTGKDDFTDHSDNVPDRGEHNDDIPF